MWNNVCLSKVLVLTIFAMDTLGFKISKPLSREQIYMDVLKNITRVHKILNNLLGNYKHLKTIYEEQATPENQLSDEIVVEEVHEKKDHKTDLDNDIVYHPVTQMILDEEFVEDSSDKSKEELTLNIEAEDVKKKIQPQFPDTAKIDSANVKKSNVDVTNKIKPNNNYIHLPRTDLLLQNKVTKTKSATNLSNKPDLIIVGTALRYSPNDPVENENVENDDFKKRENEFSSIINQNKPILRAGYTYIDKVSDNEYRSDINQATKWRNPNDFSFHQSNRNNDIGNKRKNRSVVVLVVNREQKNLLLRNTRYESDSEIREEELLSRNQLERKILRDAYGSACLKVAVRKCYKTLVAVRKLICMMDFKCKDSFKEQFKSNSKVGCISEFDYRGKEKGNKDKKNSSRYFGSDEVEELYTIQRPEYNVRSGFNINYFELCLPVMSEDTNTEILNRGKESPHVDKIEPIHILRDRYEKECQRLSTEKCERACEYAVTKTCEAKDCERHNRKYFTRTCKQECKDSFGGRTNSDDDDTDSDDDSDSDDDDGSDDGDGDGDSLSLE